MVVSFRPSGRKHRVILPVPVFLLPSLSAMAVDLFDFFVLVSFGRAAKLRKARGYTRCADAALRQALRIDDPYDLVDIQTEDLMIKCSFI